MVPQITNFSQIGKSSIFLPRKAQSALVLKVTAPDRVKIGFLPAHYRSAARDKRSLNQKDRVKLKQRDTGKTKIETSIVYMETVMHCSKRNWNLHAREC